MRSGELGRVVHTTSLAPHRLNRALRPAWFFDRPAYGGIINDIGVHSIDQFLAFADADDAGIEHAAIGAFGTEPEGFEDFAEIMLATQSVRGYVRLDWFTPDGLPTWGDGRFFVVGTRRDAGVAEEHGYRGARGNRSPVCREPVRDAVVDCSALPVMASRAPTTTPMNPGTARHGNGNGTTTMGKATGKIGADNFSAPGARGSSTHERVNNRSVVSKQLRAMSCALFEIGIRSRRTRCCSVAAGAPRRSKRHWAGSAARMRAVHTYSSVHTALMR